MFCSLELQNPIVFAFIGGLVIYIILLLEKKQLNNKEIAYAKVNNTTPNIKNNVPLKLPIIVGLMIWGATNYFYTDNFCIFQLQTLKILDVHS